MKKNIKIFSFGFSLLLIVAGFFITVSPVQAAVTVTTQPMEMISPGQTAKASSSDIPIAKFAIGQDAGETLSSVIVTIANVAGGVTSSEILNLKVYKDEGNGILGAEDLVAGTQTTVNIGAPTTITTSTNNTIGIVATPTIFFVTLATNATWSDNVLDPDDAIGFSIATNGIVTSGVSPTVTLLTGANSLTADTTAPAEILVQDFVFIQNAPVVEDQIAPAPSVSIGMQNSIIKVYLASDGTTLIGQATLGSDGRFAPINIGDNANASVKLQVVDPAGNTNTMIEKTGNDIVAPTATATAYTDRIIIQFSENVDGMMAMNCANYTVGGTVLTCGGMGLPFIDFQGDKATIKGLNLSGTTSLVISSGNTITDINGHNSVASYNSGSLPVTTLVLPAITSIANNVGGASSGAVGDTLTITGTNFGAGPAGANFKVFFSGGFDPMTGPTPPIEATSFTSWSATSIVVAVPTGAQSGPVNVMVDGVMSDMNQNSFFDIAASYNVKVYYGGSADSPTNAMADGDAGNIRIVVGGMGGQVVHYVGDGTTTYDAVTTDTFTITGVSSMGWTWAYDITGAHLNSQGQQVDTSATKNLILATTSRKISGTITLGVGDSCTTDGQSKDVVIFAMPEQVDTSGTNFKPIDPAFFKTNGSCTVNYSVGIPINGVYRVEAHIPPEANATSVSSSKFTDPESLPVTISDSATTATGKDFAFTAATHKIMGHVQKPGGAVSTIEGGMLYVFAYQPRENGKGTGTQVDSSGNFTLNVTPGTWKVGVGGGNMPFPVEVSIDVDSTYLISAYTAGTKTIIIAPPADFIEGYVKDSAGNGLANVSLYSWLEGAPGGGNANTDSQGYYKMYVTPGSNYHVGANSQAYGFLGEQSNIAVTGSTHPTVNFTVSSSNYIVSGTVQKDGVALQQAFVFITSGEYGQMLGSDGTSATGTFSVRVSGGSGLYLHVGLPGKGEIYSASLSPINADTALSTINILASTITVRISLASSFTQAFVGVHSDGGGGFSDTDVAVAQTYREYQIDVQRSATYYIDGGIPGYGPLPQISVAIAGDGTFTESLTNQSGGSATDGIIEITLGGLYTVSGTVTGDNKKDAWVFASGPNGGGGGAVAENGTYSFQLRNGTYDIGVGKPGYIGNKITSIVNGVNLSAQNLILTTATDTITGTVYLPDGTTPAVNAQVWAENGNGGMGGGSTDASGNYSLNVSAGGWTVKAAYDGYNSNGILVTAPATGKNITLVTVAGFAPNTKNSPITPSDGGIMSGTGFKIDFPKNALGTSSSAGTVEVKSTTNVVQKNDRQLIGTAKEFTVRNSDNQNVTTLSGSATIELTVSKAELVSSGLAFSKIKDIKITYYDSTGGSWIEIPTVVTLSVPDAVSIAGLDDDPAITLTGTTTHLSTYAPSIPTDSDAPPTPTGLSATAGNLSATLSWTASSGATKYDIYKKVGDDYPYLAQTTSTSYSASGLVNNTTYYFKVSALDGSDRESAATSEVSVTPVAPSSNVSGSYSKVTYATPVVPVTTVVSPVVSDSTTPASYNFGTAILKNGSKGEAVKELQRFLNAKLNLGLVIDGRLGPKTITVIKQWQKDNGLVADGLIGAKTKAMMNSLVQ
ncbi:MAG: carboxypeptidase regulatory-like domain-containing protein [Candidatus Paceibacterota bacterium]